MLCPLCQKEELTIDQDRLYAYCSCGAKTKEYNSLYDLEQAYKNDSLTYKHPSGGDNIDRRDAVFDVTRKDLIKINSKEWAKVYKAKIIESGVCGYAEETILIKNDALDLMMPSFAGKPVIIDHDTDNGYVLTPDNMEDKAVGYVSECYYDENHKSYWVKFVIFNEEAKIKIEKNNYKVSCAYMSTDIHKNGGTWHNIKYNSEIMSGVYTHLALVQNPRYEDAIIYENSKDNEEKPKMFKMFKTKKEEITASNPVVQVENGVEIPISDLVDAYRNSKTETIDLDSTVEVDGKQVKVSDLLNAYKKNMNKKNEIETDQEPQKTLDEKEKENEEDEEKDKEEEKENKQKKNSHYEKLKDARNNSIPEEKYETMDSRIERGQIRYGKASNVEKK